MKGKDAYEVRSLITRSHTHTRTYAAYTPLFRQFSPHQKTKHRISATHKRKVSSLWLFLARGDRHFVLGRDI